MAFAAQLKSEYLGIESNLNLNSVQRSDVFMNSIFINLI